ncbi:hypothetical protein PAHAL_1G119500 [Panicum hallii]|uniref:Uncharacterized protein n=1 Tax=Panicum hallii TaxID=206008 RepID=A0A2T8KUZ2_9POAL|nr:hypothetical protein PAHAL_1G119500 [Panicum hallii]
MLLQRFSVPRPQAPLARGGGAASPAITKAEGSSSKKVCGFGAVQLPRALVQRPMQQSASATAPGAPVAVDTDDVQQLLEEMPLRLVHFLISQVGNETCTLTCIANCPEHLY